MNFLLNGEQNILEEVLHDFFECDPWFPVEKEAEPQPPPTSLSSSASHKRPKKFTQRDLLMMRLDRVVDRRARVAAEDEKLTAKREKLALEKRRFEKARELAATVVRSYQHLRHRDYAAELEAYYNRHDQLCGRATDVQLRSEKTDALEKELTVQRQLLRHCSLPVSDLIRHLMEQTPSPLPARVLRALFRRLDCLGPLLASQNGSLFVRTFENGDLFLFIALDPGSHALLSYIVIRKCLLIL